MGFERFQSICGECGQPVPAAYIRTGDAVYLEKTCPEHGMSRALASEDADAFERWLAFPSVTVPPRVFVTKCARPKEASQKVAVQAAGPESQGQKGTVHVAGQEPSQQETKENSSYGSRGSSTYMDTECPLHCGPCENHLMTACCVLLNVTNRCNQRCPCCFADAGYPPSGEEHSGNGSFRVQQNDVPVNTQYVGAGSFHVQQNDVPVNTQHIEAGSFHVQQHDPSVDPKRTVPAVFAQEPTLDDIGRWLDRLIELGEERKFNIQISGGEPTVRDDLPDIIQLCKAKGFEYIQLNTNGRLLAEGPAYARTLKASGLSTVFMQFDGVDDEVFLALRGEALFETKKAAIRNCGAAGLPVTLVPTVMKNVNLAQTGAIIDFMLDNVSVVKGVHFQPASFFGRISGERNAEGDFDERVTMFAIMDEIEKQTGGRIKKADLAPISTGHPLCCFCAAFMKEKGGVLRPLSSGGSCCDAGSNADADADDAANADATGAVAADAAANACATGAVAPTAARNPRHDPLEIIRRDRDFVLNKWDIRMPGETRYGDGLAVSGMTASCDGTECHTASSQIARTGKTPPCNGPECSDASGQRAQLDESDGVSCGKPCNCRDTESPGGSGAMAMSFDEAIAMFKDNSFTVSGMAFMDGTNLDAERLRRCRVQVFTPDGRLVPFCAYYAFPAMQKSEAKHGSGK